MIAESQLDEPEIIDKVEEIFRSGIPYTTGEEFLKIVPEFADVILVLSDNVFPSTYTYANGPINTKNHEVLSCKCEVLGRHVIFFCEIKADNGQQTKRFNIIICPKMQSEFIKSLQDIAMQQQKPLQLVLMGKYAYEFHVRNISESDSIGKAGYRLKNEIKRVPHLMRNFVRCDDVDISAILFDYYRNLLYEGVFFDTFEAVKQYCPICSIKK